MRVKSNAPYTDSRGRLGQVRVVQRACVDWHKATYENFATLKMSDGKRHEVEEEYLEKATAIEALAWAGDE